MSSRNWKEYSMVELTVKVKKEFISANEHFRVGEKYTAYENEDRYVVRVHAGDLQVPKEEFDKYFIIINTIIHSVSC